MSLKILTDLHHRDLYYSQHCLLEKRLGHELYRPIGSDWTAEGWWIIHAPQYDHAEPRLIDQYLEPNTGENIQTPGSYRSHGVFNIKEQCHNYYQRCIPLSLFKEMEFDIIMPSHWCHYHLWKKLRDRYQPKAKFICHIGNVDCQGEYEYVIRSVPVPGSMKLDVLVHQELDTNIYQYTPINPDTKNIYSVTNGYMFAHVFNRFKEALPDYNFRYYGIGGPDGILSGTQGVYQKMAEANMGWSTKGWGGLGHSNMAWMYCGRTVITNMSQQKLYGECALKLFEPGVTCIDVEAGTTQEVCDQIRDWTKPENANKYGEAAKQRFHEMVNYEAEAEMAKAFIEKVLDE